MGAEELLRGFRYCKHGLEQLAAWIILELRYRDFDEILPWYDEILDYLEAWADNGSPHLLKYGLALLGCNDRFFLLTELLGREDLKHPWLFDRCREVESQPDGYIDLWARGHGKSSIITTGGIIQELMCDPEITIAIFSVTKPTAIEFLAQIKNEFETNEYLKAIYDDVLYTNPRSRGPDGRPAKWGTARGITVKRKGKPKEGTVEAHGLIDGQPTGRHFKMHVYDDVVTQDYLSDEQMKKTTARFQMADNLGTRHGVRKQIIGTRYHFGDTYGVIIETGSAKERKYPATDDGTLAGKPILLTSENWERIKRDQGTKTVSAQMLLNPLAGSEATFRSEWMQSYDVFPAVLNVYILIDPSKGKGERSDRSAIAVIGIDQGGNKYLLDGARHRMKLSERWEFIKSMKRKWENHPGVQMVRVGYEQYGMIDDISVINDMMLRENIHFEIVELATPESGGHSKPDRIDRLEPDLRTGRFLLPNLVHSPEMGGKCFWAVWTQERDKEARAKGEKHSFYVNQLLLTPAKDRLTKRQQTCKDAAQSYRIVDALKRRDENSDVYDLTRVFIEEAIRHPFAPHDDLIDAVSRIYDIKPIQPVAFEARSTEPLGLDTDELAGMEDDVVHYDDTSGSMGNPF